MRITEDIRRYADEQGITEEDALEEGMRNKAEEFKRSGSELYLEESKQ
jgi:phosphomethylpyrimidine synthase